MRKYSLLFTTCILLFNAPHVSHAQTITEPDNIGRIVRFLISDRMLTLSASGKLIPLSFYVGNEDDIATYFGDYICTSENTCTVIDTIYQNSQAILGRGLAPMDGTELEWRQAQAQIERTNIKYGTDIYHAATWQIALGLASEKGFLDETQARNLIANQLDAITNPLNRAIGLAYRYGGQIPIFDPRLAFTFRWLATNLYNRDPFFNGRYQNYISSDFNLSEIASINPSFLPSPLDSFVTTWSDYKPLTGKNAWAQLIGPLQAEYLLNKGQISAYSPALLNAMNTLTAFSLMQAGIGAFYHAPAGTEGPQSLIPATTILIEDNLAVLAGLQILKKVLENTEKTAEVIVALARIDVMLNGGQTPNGFRTNGLLSFLFNGAFDTENGIFFISGTAPIPSSTNDWRPDRSGFASFTAVNTNLWALSALGVETIDTWFGSGSALKIWLTVRQKGGYFANGEFRSVGFSFNNNRGIKSESIMTTAGTAAAINALNSLIDFYGDQGPAVNLLNDLEGMRQNIILMRNDLYLDANFIAATDREFFIRVPESTGQAYLDASKRFSIPSDWNANTLASTNANAWVIMNHFNFNPFQYKGQLAGENYAKPERINILNSDFEPPGGELSKTVLVRFRAGNLGNFKKLAIRYNLDGSQTNWHVLLITDKREGFVTLPQGTKAISISFATLDFANACQIIPANRLCLDEDCLNVKIINARWTSNGLGSCELSR
ncbi:MAG: hypothetical protein H0U73_08640 [Tatlockia sp.]|nr:hypothetical protein [Tatlockia sp.]